MLGLMKTWSKLEVPLFRYLGLHVHIVDAIVPTPWMFHPSAATTSCLPKNSCHSKTLKFFFGIM